MNESHINQFDLYRLSVEEELKFIEMHQGRVKFFLGILSGIFAGTIAGLYKATLWYHFALMSIGPILIFATCIIAIRGAFRLYQRFLEAVSVRAKLEQQMGLTEPVARITKDDYWPGEPIVAPRHIESRKNWETSKEWIDAHSNKGYQLWTTSLFKGGQLLALGLLIVIIGLSYSSYQEEANKRKHTENLSAALQAFPCCERYVY